MPRRSSEIGKLGLDNQNLISLDFDDYKTRGASERVEHSATPTELSSQVCYQITSYLWLSRIPSNDFLCGQRDTHKFQALPITGWNKGVRRQKGQTKGGEGGCLLQNEFAKHAQP